VGVSERRGNQIGAAAIMQNNIRVTIMTFALGAMMGLGTIYYLAFNAQTSPLWSR
jgi:uncharacterized membrane protein SpoIIM required for sporulation